jgi:hypothetical protein
MSTDIPFHQFSPSSFGHPIIGFQSSYTRALTVGYIAKKKTKETFIPCRLNFGATREDDAFQATVQSLQLPPIYDFLKRQDPMTISTVILLRETLSCRLSSALYYAGISTHYGDCFIGANHVKTATSITTSYTYENTEGLCEDGVWIIADSIAAGRNLIATLKSMLGKYHPKELLFIVPIGNRWGINEVSKVVAEHNIPATFVVWGALFGLNPINHYDEPWGLPDCEPIDERDRKTFISMYSSNLCVGGDFGNDFYCPAIAKKLYDKQLADLQITPHVPPVTTILKTYKRQEFVNR